MRRSGRSSTSAHRISASRKHPAKHSLEVVITDRRGGKRSEHDAGFGGLARPTSAQQVAQHIRTLIFDNRLRTGDRVPQDEIAADLRVSRVPVREAIIALDREGWVTSEPHRGAFVNGLDENSTRDHYDLLGMLYGYTARRATERGTGQEVEALEVAHRRLQAAADPDECLAWSTEFLRRLLVMARSRRITAMARLLTTNLVPGNFFAEVPGVMDIQKAGLRVVTAAIVDGDGATAQRELAAMLHAQADKVVDLLKARQLL